MRHVVAGLLGLSVVGVAACVPAVPLPTPQGPASATAEDVVAAAVTPREGAGAIHVTRTKVLHDMSCVYDIQLDGQNVAALRRGEHVTLYADPGRRLVGVSVRDSKGCEPTLAHVPVEVIAHTTTEIRVGATASYDLKIEATTR